VEDSVASRFGEEIAVEVRDLKYRYGTRTALAGIDFTVASKQIFGLLGPNGGGKTTLFHILSTLAKPDSGAVLLFGTDLVRDPGKARPQMGVVFQRPSLDLHLRVDENLIHQGHLYGLRGSELTARMERLLDRFGVIDRRRDLAGTLSGGLQRRVEIAKALLHDPRLLILDEPSSGLDPGARRDLWRVLADLRDESQTTVLLTTHFIEEADRCDRLGLIDAGRLIAIDEPDALKSEIGGDVVVARVDDAQLLAEALRTELGVECAANEREVRFEHPRAHELLRRVLEIGSDRIESLTLSKPTLEDVFLKRTGHGIWGIE